MTDERPTISELPYVRTSLTELMQENLDRPEWLRRLMLGEVCAIAVPAVHVAAEELTQLKRALGRTAFERTGAHPVVMHAEEIDRGSLTKQQENELKEGRPILVHYCLDRFLAQRGSAGRRVNPARIDRINNARNYMVRQSIEYIGRILSGDPAEINAGEAKKESIPELAYIWPKGTPFNTYTARIGFLDRQFTAGDHVKVHSVFLPTGTTVGMSIQREFQRPSPLLPADRAKEQEFWITVWHSAVLANEYAEKQFSAQARLSKKLRQNFDPTNVRQFVGFDRRQLTVDDVMPLAYFGAFDIGYVVRGVSSYFQQFEAAAAIGDVCRGNLARFNAHQVEYLCGLLRAPSDVLETFHTADGLDDNRLRPRVMNHRSFLRHAMLRFRPLDWWLSKLTSPYSRFSGSRYVSADCTPSVDPVYLSEIDVELDERVQVLRWHLLSSLQINLHFDTEITHGGIAAVNYQDIYVQQSVFASYGIGTVDEVIDWITNCAAVSILKTILHGRDLNIIESCSPYYYEDLISVEWCTFLVNEEICPSHAANRELNADYLARMISNDEFHSAKTRGEWLAARILEGYPQG